MNEQKIIRAILNGRQEYDRVVDHLDPKDFSPECAKLLKEISDFYDNDPRATECDSDIIASRIERGMPNPKHAAAIINVLKSLPDVSGANVVQEILDVKASNIGLELASGFAAGKDAKAMRPLVDKYIELVDRGSIDSPGEEIQGVKVSDLVSRRLGDDGLIQLAPKSLNDRLDGGVRRGHHVVIFAPTEMGKTAFVINAVRHFLRQKLRVLYVGNEDPADDIMLRVVCSITGWNKFQVKEKQQDAQKAIDDAGWDNFIFSDQSPGTFPRITRLVRKHSPSVVILDQLSNINVQSKSDGAASLEVAAKAARALAKGENVLVISVTQAADSATGKAVLERGDIHNSNVGIPGQADLMVGIGATREMEARGQRNLSLVKDKISGNHDNFLVNLNPQLSRVN